MIIFAIECSESLEMMMPEICAQYEITDKHLADLVHQAKSFQAKNGISIFTADNQEPELIKVMDKIQQIHRQNGLPCHWVKRLEEIAFPIQKPRKSTRPIKERVQEVIEYMRKNGSCSIPYSEHADISPEERSLQQLVTKFRHFYRNDRLSIDVVAALNAVGFEWDPFLSNWQTMLLKLVEFQKEYGHCQVPNNKQHKKLFNWCARQRYSLHGNKASDKRAQLSEIGFIWSVQDANWWERFHELEASLKQNGVWPIKGKIGQWVVTQRRKYRSGNLIPERIKQLENVGIVWRPRPGKRCKNSSYTK